MTDGERSDRGQVFSIRFTPKELEALRALAAREDMRISDVVRAALANYLTRQGDPVVHIDAPRDARVYIYTGVPATSETLAHHAISVSGQHEENIEITR